MKKVLLFALAVLLTATLAADVQARRGKRLSGNTDETQYTLADQTADDEWLKGQDLARIAYVAKDDTGVEAIFIRLPPAMYRNVKARAKVKRRGVVRVVLRPRHFAAVGQATGQLPKRLELRLKAERFNDAKGVKGHYVVRPLDQFMRGDYFK